jgi:hypothetical protein
VASHLIYLNGKCRIVNLEAHIPFEETTIDVGKLM